MSPELKRVIERLISAQDRVKLPPSKKKAIIKKLKKQPKKKAKPSKWGVFKYCKRCKRQYDGKHYVHECHLKAGKWYRREFLKSQFLAKVEID